ncbi:hypothetical protein [Streptomyces parvus]|uniref:hypothetical protein n=1 Tax=Streptomyces parvus TaxID=66428 RepID=UPI0028B1108F|nr:hypothetical protein [Streptomyces parvus]
MVAGHCTARPRASRAMFETGARDRARLVVPRTSPGWSSPVVGRREPGPGR